MAGSCTGLGVRINGFNEVEASVDRVVAWPYPGSVNAKSGVRVDPNGILWTPPDQIIQVAEAPLGPNKTIVPNSDSTVKLIDLSLEMVASKDHDQVLFVFHLVGGYQGYRLSNGNFWALYRYIVTYDNGTPTTYSGLEEVGGAENNAGGSLGSSSTVEGMIGMAVKPGGTKFKVLAHYELHPLAFTDGPTNAFAWRPPRLQVAQWSMPQPVEA